MISDFILSSPSYSLLLDPSPMCATTDFRLPLDWSKERARELLAASGVKGDASVLLCDPWNIVYFTGLWALTTERLLAVLLPGDGSDPIWFYPYLDHELVTTWWYGDGDYYFDVPIAEDQLPGAGLGQDGGHIGQFAWLWKRLATRGYTPLSPTDSLTDSDTSRFVTDVELPHVAETAATHQFGSSPRQVADWCMSRRMQKTDEELALWAHAYEYFDASHMWVRDRLMSGVDADLTDMRLRNELSSWVVDRIMEAHGPITGPHQGVGINIDLGWIRAGGLTSYPHPNQFRYNKISESRILQLSGIIQLGGCGGELYRPYMLQSPTAHERMLWEVTRDSCLLMKQELRAGRTASEVAQKIFDFQVAQGVSEYVFTRPSHGQGMEGHQPPFLSLGDTTELKPGMCFSVEPGLYDMPGGIGINFSDTFVVQESGEAEQLSRIPWSTEWAWLA